MRCKVFRLYRHGAELSPAMRERDPVAERLVYAPRLKHDQIRLSVFTAQLLALDSDRCVIPVLNAAIVMKISGRGMLLSGQEVIARNGSRNARSDYYRQAWVVKPIAEGSDV